jgi:DnaJ-class molecular chaperone
MADQDNPLKVLGLPSACTLADVRERYRILCLKYHPDKNPGSEGLFQAVTEAYNKIRANPRLVQVPRAAGPASYLDGEVVVTMKDFYYAEQKSVSLQRMTHCRPCAGTGAKSGKAGVCQCCDGQGIIESSALALFGRDNICPMCKGSGIVGDPCPSCHGEKMIKESITAKFRATLYIYYKKHVMLKGLGNGRADGSHEDLMIRVNVHEDPYITVEHNYFKVRLRTTPAQIISGDSGLLEIFDRRIPYVIKPRNSEVVVTDGIRPGFAREVHIILQEYIPEVTPETAELYGKIIELEKKTCALWSRCRASSPLRRRHPHRSGRSR